MSGFDGCGMIGPVSHPGVFELKSSAGRFVIGTIIVESSCSAAYRLYGNLLSTHTPYSSDVGWLFWVVHVRPPSVETFAPPSFAWTIVFPSRGLIQMSWLSPCGVGNERNVRPPSVDLKNPSAPAYTTSAFVGSAVSVV